MDKDFESIRSKVLKLQALAERCLLYTSDAADE